ncbi:MAG: FAD-dependent oxidoreductase [Nocardioidaceae bacterium]|nr:FAD-dependent oxidoreductase [Nocardioidaceae bacterium]
MESPSLWQERRTAPARPHLPVPENVDDLVVGAGLAGLTTGVLLARAGRKVAVVDARPLGSGTSARTTAKVSLLQGTKLSRLLRRHPPEVARAYVEANRVAQDWLLGFCGRRDVSFQTREAVTYAGSPQQVEATRAEFQAAASLGLPVHWHDSLDVPFETHGAVALGEQAQLDPVALLEALADELIACGGTLHPGERLTAVAMNGEARLDSGARVVADQVVLATGTPVLDRTLCFARLTPSRSYLLAFSGDPGTEQMLISAGSPTRSMRQLPAMGDDRPVFLVGGAGHVVGRAESPRAHLDELRAWTITHFPGATETHAWSAQDYRSLDELPLAGRLAVSGERIHVATGFDKWGMTNAVAAARRIAATILGGVAAPWPESSHPSPGSLLRALGLNLQVAGLLVSDWAEVELGGSTADATVVRHRMVPTVPGEHGGYVGVCTHLGGILHWNDAERTWDCPLHGSRFAPDGEVLEGPATKPLRRRAS